MVSILGLGGNVYLGMVAGCGSSGMGSSKSCTQESSHPGWPRFMVWEGKWDGVDLPYKEGYRVAEDSGRGRL
jgi:hypothetical protein